MTQRKSSRQSVTVKIAGEKHVLRSDAPPEYTRSVAAHVDATIRELGSAQPLETHRVTVLAALLITDELFRLREQVRLLSEELERRTAALAQLLESAAAEGPSLPAPAEERPEPTPPDRVS